jgi:hypothetical protein
VQHITHGMLDEGGALGRNACRNVFQRGGESEPSRAPSAFHATVLPEDEKFSFSRTVEESVMSTRVWNDTESQFASASVFYICEFSCWF